jgi:FMN phosphatase YigB (HAD superfamily)
MHSLNRSGVTIGVLSDYPAADKLAALELEADLQVSAVDPEVDRLKPHPRGLQRVIEICGVATEQVVMIGDRDERDGECARRAGTRYLIKSSVGQPGMHRFSEYADLLNSFEQRSAEDAALQ